MAARSEEATMLDGKQYFAEFPDEDPTRKEALLSSPQLLASLRALERELRPYLVQRLETGVFDADDA
jgi:hypothetical protein